MVRCTAPEVVRGTAPKMVGGTAPEVVRGTAPEVVRGTANQPTNQARQAAQQICIGNVDIPLILYTFLGIVCISLVLEAFS